MKTVTWEMLKRARPIRPLDFQAERGNVFELVGIEPWTFDPAEYGVRQARGLPILRKEERRQSKERTRMTIVRRLLLKRVGVIDPVVYQVEVTLVDETAKTLAVNAMACGSRRRIAFAPGQLLVVDAVAGQGAKGRPEGEGSYGLEVATNSALSEYRRGLLADARKARSGGAQFRDQASAVNALLRGERQVVLESARGISKALDEHQKLLRKLDQAVLAVAEEAQEMEVFRRLKAKGRRLKLLEGRVRAAVELTKKLVDEVELQDGEAKRRSREGIAPERRGE